MKKTIGELKKNKLKLTPQRLAIIEYLQKTKSHPSAEEIYEVISKKYPTMSFATVYNTLTTLKETGSLSELTMDPDKKRFDMDMTPHHHFYCRICKKIFDVIMPLSFSHEFAKDCGHSIEHVSLHFTGSCKTCKK